VVVLCLRRGSFMLGAHGVHLQRHLLTFAAEAEDLVAQFKFLLLLLADALAKCVEGIQCDRLSYVSMFS
jgi:hypothetical protein